MNKKQIAEKARLDKVLKASPIQAGDTVRWNETVWNHAKDIPFYASQGRVNGKVLFITEYGKGEVHAVVKWESGLQQTPHTSNLEKVG